MKIKEFDEKTLKQLIIDLKDVDNYKSFKHGSFIYDLGYYQGNLLINEIERLNNIIDEFEDWLGKQRIRNCEWDNFVIKDTRLGIPITYLLNKLKELKDSD